jgi:hypothetical protein
MCVLVVTRLRIFADSLFVIASSIEVAPLATIKRFTFAASIELNGR